MLVENRPQGNKKSQHEITDALMRLERSYKNILELKTRLNSYSCEPRTYNLFEQLEDLKLSIELIAISHIKLMTALKSPAHFVEVQLQQVKEQIKDALILENRVSDYICLAK
ncbi:hypothetical protein [Maribacter sp.]|uniref:hypothetical protein n=1 Tax=Maribacter sp. TaxID=1897614 RepID=UPI0025BB35C8|nr:hypothetical protein [Maribacter sp.]